MDRRTATEIVMGAIMYHSPIRLSDSAKIARYIDEHGAIQVGERTPDSDEIKLTGRVISGNDFRMLNLGILFNMGNNIMSALPEYKDLTDRIIDSLNKLNKVQLDHDMPRQAKENQIMKNCQDVEIIMGTLNLEKPKVKPLIRHQMDDLVRGVKALPKMHPTHLIYLKGFRLRDVRDVHFQYIDDRKNK